MSAPNKKPPAATEGFDDNTTGFPQVSNQANGAQPAIGKFWPDDEEAPPTPPPAKFDLPLPPDGLVGDLAKYFLSSARYPMLEGALMAALALTAGIAGRCFNVADSGLNLYLVVLAPSGRGKEDMRAGIDRMLSSVRRQVPAVDDHIGPDTFASGQALIRALSHQPCFVSVQGEFGLRLKELNDRKAPASTVVLRRALLDIYGKSGEHGLVRPLVYSDREKNTDIIVAPALTILGESTPEHVYDNLHFSDITDGLLPRCLVVECTSDRPRANKDATHAPSPELIENFASFATTCVAMEQNEKTAGVMPTPDAATAFKNFQDILDDRFNDGSRDPHNRALWNRAALNIRRIAALVAVGCMRAGDTTAWIQKAHVEWAIALVTYCVESLAAKFHAGEVGTGEARQEAEMKRIAREYLRLPPKSRRSSYKVPEKLANDIGTLSVSYLRRRAAQCSAFKTARDFNVAFRSTLQALCDSGWLFKMHPLDVQNRYGARMGDVYGIGEQGLSDCRR